MIGTDIENISRFKTLYIKKAKLLQKMFNQSEWEYSVKKANPAQTLTGIWCAKEAVLKAIYNQEQVFIKDITIKHKASGVPYVIVNHKGIDSKTIHISISHSKDYATAVAIIIKD